MQEIKLVFKTIIIGMFLLLVMGTVVGLLTPRGMAQTNYYIGVYQCQNAKIILDLRSDGTAVFEHLTGRTWKETGTNITIYIGPKAYATFKKEGQDLIREKTGTRYVKVRDFQ